MVWDLGKGRMDKVEEEDWNEEGDEHKNTCASLIGIATRSEWTDGGGREGETCDKRDTLLNRNGIYRCSKEDGDECWELELHLFFWC